MAQNLFGTSLAEVQKAAFDAQERRRQQAGLMSGQNSQSPALASGLGQAVYQMASTMGSGGGLTAAEQRATQQEIKSKHIQTLFADPAGTREEKIELANQLVNSGNEFGVNVGRYYGKKYSDEIREETRRSELASKLKLNADIRLEDQQQRLYGYKLGPEGKYVFDGSAVTGNINTDHPVEGHYYSTKSPNTNGIAITNTLGGEAYDQKLMDGTIKVLREGLDDVKNSIRSLRTFSKASQQLDDPETKIFLGAGSEIRTNLLKAFDAVGLGSPDSKKAIADTEAFLALMNQSSADLLASGAFGAGTGISDRDLKEVKKIVGASQGLTKDGIKLILKVRAAMEIHKIKEYEAGLDLQKPRVWGAVDQEKAFFYRSQAIPKYWQQPDPKGEDSSRGKGWVVTNSPVPITDEDLKNVKVSSDMGGTKVVTDVDAFLNELAAQTKED